MKKKLVLMTSFLMTFSLIASCGNNPTTEPPATTTSETTTVSQHTHQWGLISYTWAEDNTKCTAKRVCTEDSTHVEEETVNTTYEVVTEAKCEEDGKGRYTADFTSEAFVDQTKDIILEAIGHDLTAHDAHGETCTEAGNSAYWSCERCGKFFSDAEGKNEIENGSWIIPAHHTLTHHERKEATRLEDGNIEYWSCDVCEKYFSDEEGKNEINAESIIIPALGTDKTYFNGTYWLDSSFEYVLNFITNNFSDYDINYEYYFSSFDYDDETKELSFIITRLENMVEESSSPYKVGDKISFTYDAENEALMFGTVKLSKRQN
ncbi:MAG: hypothetical protein IJ194_02000 [Bacilli bacterium]|nr:hypothetical protein [Bacilli bacterium]